MGTLKTSNNPTTPPTTAPKVIAHILSVLNTDLNSLELFQHVAKAIEPLIPFDRFSLSVGQVRFWFYYENGQVSTERDRGLFSETSMASFWVFIHEKPILRKDISADPRFAYDPDLTQEQMHSDLILPLYLDEEIIGTFNFTSIPPNTYTQTHLETASELADTLGAVVKQMQARRNLRAIQRVQQSLIDAKDLDLIFEAMARHLHILYDRIRIYLYDPNKEVLQGRFQGGIMKVGNFGDFVYPLADDPYSQKTFSDTVPKIYRTDKAKEVWTEKSEVKHTKEWAEIPLKVQRDNHEIIVGKLSLDNISTRVPLRESDLNRSMIFVTQAALAIYHVQLRNEMALQVARQTTELTQNNRALEEAAQKLQDTNKELLTENYERRQTEQALRESRQKYRSLFENMVQGFAFHEIVVDSDGKPTDYIFREINEAFETLTGLKAKDILNKRVTKALPGTENDPADWIGTYGQVALTGQSIAFENYSETIGKWYRIWAYSPQKGYFACIFEDITSRKEADEDRASLLAFQREMLDTPVVWISAFDNYRTMTFWNRAAENISGYRTSEALGSKNIWEKLYPDPEYLQKVIDDSSKLIRSTGKLENFETTIQCKDGTHKTISWQLNRLHPKDPKSGYLTIGTDITHHKQMEEELVRIERLKALGELAAGVSHNLNNMLTGILGPAELIKLNASDPVLQINIQDIVTSATRARDLVRQLNQVVRKDVQEQLEAVDLSTIVTQAIRATRPRWKDEAESQGIRYTLQAELPPDTYVSATETGVHDVLLNLIFNALDAMPQGGDITIKTQSLSKGTRLSITDTGIGMDEETRRKVFEPFFTTKTDVGTGMGLATVHAAIERWNAQISVQSKLSQGTTFTIDFQNAQRQTPPPLITKDKAARTLNILVVEDDRIVAKVMQRVLSPTHSVTVVTNGEEAIKLSKTICFDIAFIDLGLPDQPGDRVGRQLKHQTPTLQTILTTGWQIEDHDPRRVPFDHVLPKPASPQQIQDAVNKTAQNLHA